MRQKLTKAEIAKAYAEFEEGIQTIRKDLRELVKRTIKNIDEKQTRKILQRIRAL